MSLLDSFLNMFRRKPEDAATEKPKDIDETPKASPSVNSITLSPDMSTLFLIDNGRAFSFDLTNGYGAVIGTLNGQLTVASALPDIVEPPTEDDDPDTSDPPEGPTEEGGIDADSPVRRLATRPRLLKLSIRRTQWTLMFVKRKAGGILSIIGASDIDTSIIGASDIDTSIIGASDIDTSIIGASDIDTSLTRGIESDIIGASDIDTSLARSLEEPAEPDPTTDEPAPVHTNCKVYSFLINTRSIQLKMTRAGLEIEY